MFRAAERWRVTIGAARQARNRLGEESYKEIYFEDLLEDPELVMKDLCRYIGVQYISAMTRLTSPSENLGDARGALHIMKENKKKYNHQLSSMQIKRIEEVVYPVMQETPYTFEYAQRYQPLGRLEKAWYKLTDGMNVLDFYFRQKGIRSGLVYLFLIYKKSSWRKA